MNICTRSIWLAVVALLLIAPAASAVVNIEWVTVGDPGNAADSGSYGSVAEEYRIGKYEVSNTEYAEFLNAVAKTDANDLYHANMGSVLYDHYGGITRSGSPGSYTYSTILGREDMPVNWVTFWDAIRFANWLHNGQPTGAQDNPTTEDGAYTLTAAGIADNSVTRNEWGTVFVASEDEWYKAAYYDAAAQYYFHYPTGSDTKPSCTWPTATPNTANCDSAVDDVTVRGGYSFSGSPNGTFDQGGNVWEWNDTIIDGVDRGFRGGSHRWVFGQDTLASSYSIRENEPIFHSWSTGFRVASPVPPPLPSLSPFGMATLWSLLGVAGYRRLRASHTSA